MAYWLVNWTLGRAVWVLALARVIVSVVFLGKTLYSHSASLHPGAQILGTDSTAFVFQKGEGEKKTSFSGRGVGREGITIHVG